MRERFDFSSISDIILKNCKRDNFRKKYFDRLFAYVLTKNGAYQTEESNISKILHGERSVPGDIATFYQFPENKEHLKKDIQVVMKEVFDINKVKAEIEELILWDSSLSNSLKEELLKKDIAREQITKEEGISKEEEEIFLFLANCIIKSLSRNHIKKADRTGSPAKKLDLADYLLDYHYPRTNSVFLGRDRELELIHETLNENACLFLHGIGGIGKSELAKQYGKKYKKEYDNILYLHYSQNLHQTICDMAFIDDTKDRKEDELFAMHYRLFQQLNENTLVILDNFNQLLEEDELLQEFLSLSFPLLVTTRNIVEDIPCCLVKEIDLEACKELFYSYAPEGREKPDSIKAVIQEVYQHTLTVEMSAKTMRATGLEPEELLEALRNDTLHLSSPDKIRIQKDAKVKKATPREHLSRLFQVQDLPIEYQNMLQHFRLMPASGISKRLFCKWFDTADFNSVNDLISYGWLQEERKQITMHPFLHEVLGIFDTPSTKNCSEFLRRLGQEYIVDAADEIYYRDLRNLTKSVFEVIDINDNTIAFQFLEKVLKYLEKYMYYNTMGEMLDFLKDTMPLDAEHKKETATYEFYRGVEACGNSDFKKGRKHFQDSIACLNSIEISNPELAGNLYSKISFYHLLANDKKQGLHCYERRVALREYDKATTPLDSICDKAVLKLLSLEQIQPMDIQKLIDVPELSAFFQTARESRTRRILWNSKRYLS